MKAQPVIERQPARRFPVVLNITLDIPVAVKPFREGVGLRVVVVDAQQRVGERVLPC